jgi:limonene-1,2-epoxide hydrolase
MTHAQIGILDLTALGNLVLTERVDDVPTNP